MGRSAVRADMRRKPQAFALDERDMALIKIFAERNDLSRSQALRRLLDVAEATLDAELRREVALRRQALASTVKKSEAVIIPTPKCPNCGDTDLYIEFPDGKWRCDMCLGSG